MRTQRLTDHDSQVTLVLPLGYNHPHPPCPEFPSAFAPKLSSTACFRTRERPSPATSTLAIRKLSATPAKPAPVAVIGFTNSSAASAAIATAPTAITFTAANAPSARAANPALPSKWDSHFWLSIFDRNLSRGYRLRCGFASRGIQVRQERRQNSHRRQERTNVVHKPDARRIRQFPQQRRPDSPQPKRQPKESSRYRSHFAGHQLLRKHQNRGKRRRQNQSNRHAQNSRTKQIRIRQQQSERQHTQNRIPNHNLAPHAVAHRTAKKCARRHRPEKCEQMNLRAPHGHMKFVHQIKCVVRAQARQIKILREHQRHQNRQRPSNLFARQLQMRLRTRGSNHMPSHQRRNLQFRQRSSAPLRPSANVRQQNYSQQRHKREPGNAALPARQNKCRQQRP